MNSTQDKVELDLPINPKQLLGRVKGRHLRRTPSLAETDLAICCICGFQDRFDDIVRPSRWNVVVGLMGVFLNTTFSSSVRLERLIRINCVFKPLQLTRLSVPEMAILSRSYLKEKIVSTLESSLELVDGLLGMRVVKFIVYRSDVMARRSLMKMRKSVGEKTQPCGTPLLID